VRQLIAIFATGHARVFQPEAFRLVRYDRVLQQQVLNYEVAVTAAFYRTVYRGAPQRKVDHVAEDSAPLYYSQYGAKTDFRKIVDKPGETYILGHIMDDHTVLEQMRARLPSWCRDGILAGYRGSKAHNTYIPPTDPKGIDDVDVFQVFVHPPEHYLGLAGYNNQGEDFETGGEVLDIQVYDVRKFVHLLCKGNPNVHCWLWLKPEHTFVRSAPAEILISNRTGFLSIDVLNAFAGYAHGQLRRMERFEFHGQMGAKRKALVEEHGYDTKNAAHLMRLLFMGIELAKMGELKVYRDLDAEFLRTIKLGGYNLDAIKAFAENGFENFEFARAKCDLPRHVDRKWATDILLSTMQRAWEEKGITF
jgi:predicted nucleotidyltransferase